MRSRLVTLVVCFGLALASSAFGQGASTTSTLSGVVVDSAGGVVPGAEVTIKHNATGVTQSAASNAEGAYSFPSLPIGTYTVTVALQGFKTFVATDVVLTAGSPASVRAVLEVGGVEEQVLVSSRSEIVQTQSTVISSTINANQIMKLPNASRAALDFVTSLPGVTTAGGNRKSQINGLPRGVINITLDGVNVQDNTLRSTDGFFAIVNPRLDAVEEITVTTATQEASAGQGAVQIKFVTRSGGNDFTGSGYHYYRSDKLNANTWFNNRGDVAKTPLKQNQIRRARRRSDRHSGAVRRTEQGVLLLQLRRIPPAGRRDARPKHIEPARAAGHLHVCPDRGIAAAGQPAGARRSQRSDVDARSNGCRPPARHPDRHCRVARFNQLTTISIVSGSTCLSIRSTSIQRPESTTTSPRSTASATRSTTSSSIPTPTR